MHRTLFVLGPLLTLSLALKLHQEPAQEPLPQEVVARIDGQELRLEEYKDYLWRQTGKRLLPQMVDDRLIKAACERFGVAADEADVEKHVQERMEQLMQGRDAATVELEMRARGFGLDTLRDNLRTEFTRNGGLDALVRATRVASDERLRVLFDAEYGPGGVKVELRQVLCMPHVLRAERIRDGADPASLSQDTIKEEARVLAAEARQRLLGGAEFAAVAAEFSHDQASNQSGGVLAAFRPGLYGAAFGTAVEQLEVGEFSAVIESSAGFHVVQVIQRTTSEFHRVRNELVEQWMAAEPSWQEREELLAGLRLQSKIELW